MKTYEKHNNIDTEYSIHSNMDWQMNNSFKQSPDMPSSIHLMANLISSKFILPFNIVSRPPTGDLTSVYPHRIPDRVGGWLGRSGVALYYQAIQAQSESVFRFRPTPTRQGLGHW